MKTSNVTPDDLRASVFAVPPLARNNDLTLNRTENRKLIAYIEAGGITSILYGGNASFFDISLNEYGSILEYLIGQIGKSTWLVPSAGPDYGRLIDQAHILRDMAFPTVMALPQASPSTPAGVMTGLRKFAERFGRPIIVYLKSEGYLSPTHVRELFEDGLLCCVKYGIVRSQVESDDYLNALLDEVDHLRIVSGMGERPSIVHIRDFGLAGFTSGLACIAPRASNRLLRAIQIRDDQSAEGLRAAFMPMEDYRDRLGAIRVLHDAISLSGLADMGPMLPMQQNLEQQYRGVIRVGARSLLDFEYALHGSSAHVTC